MTARVPNVVIGDTVPRSGAGSWPALGPTRASPPTRGHRSCEKFRSRRTPLLGKEGWLRPLIKCREASLTGADGVVGSTTDYRMLNLPLFLVSPYRAQIRSAHVPQRIKGRGLFI